MLPSVGQQRLRVAVMQPYLFPYLGYFQLLSACDLFVFRDDVQYIQQGWINRNRILVNGAPSWITIPVAAAGHDVVIGQRQYLLEHQLFTRLRLRLRGAYRQAPHFEETMAVIDDALSSGERNVASFNVHVLNCLATHLGIATRILAASALPSHEHLDGAERVIEICEMVGASTYINPIGGSQLYDSAQFERQGITLRFLESCPPEYPQYGEPFVPSLSVIDVMMFNDVTTIRQLLQEYRLVAVEPQVPVQ